MYLFYGFGSVVTHFYETIFMVTWPAVYSHFEQPGVIASRTKLGESWGNCGWEECTQFF
jgi:hypothetical protein